MVVKSSGLKKIFVTDFMAGLYETGMIVGKIKKSVGNIFDTDIPKEPVEAKFVDEVNKYLSSKVSAFEGVKLSKGDFDKLSKEVFELLRCSLASNRTPEEIFEGLRDDPEMRAEVLEMLIGRTKVGLSVRKQNDLLEDIFSGDEELRVLLNKQKLKKEFPVNI